VLGGTRFLGGVLVEDALAGGHELTLLNRSRTNPSSSATCGALNAVCEQIAQAAFDEQAFLVRPGLIVDT
jgi:nucleoside-diphosphate-sugar epimerase